MTLIFADLIDALEDHTLATIRVKENEGNPDTKAGREYREQAETNLLYARDRLEEELRKLT